MKKIFSIIFALLLSLQVFCVTVTISNAGGNWTAAGAWVGGVPPTNADDVVATATSGNLVVNSSTLCVAKTVDFTNYVGTLSGTGTIIMSGNFKMVAGMTVTVSGNLNIAATSTITSAGIVWTGGFVPSQPVTCTLADNWQINGNFIHTTTGGAFTMNGNTFSCKGNWTQSAGRTVLGTTTITGNGTAGTSTWITAGIQNVVTINSSNTVVIGNWTQTGGSFTHIASSAISSTGLFVVNASSTINASAVTFSTFTVSGTTTLTMGADINCTTFTTTGTTTYAGAFSIFCTNATIGTVTATFPALTSSGTISFTGVGGTVTLGSNWTANNVSINNSSQVINSNTINISGNLSEATSVNKSGTTTLALQGSGTWSNSSTGSLQLPVTISGTYIISGTVRHATSTLTISSGASLTTTSSTLLKGTGTLTVNQSGIVFNAITFNSVTATTISGSEGFAVSTLIVSGAGAAITFASTETYTITSSFTLTGTAASPITFVASTPSSAYNFVLAQGATQDVGYGSPTDANSASGQTIWTYKGTIGTNVTNWNLLPTQPQTITTSN